MKYLLIPAGLAFVALVLISFFSTLGLARACTQDVTHTQSSAVRVPLNVHSGGDSVRKLVAPSAGLHCPLDIDIISRTTLDGSAPFKRVAYVLTETLLVGFTVDVSDKPPTVEQQC